jgi:hypothetical protein
MRVFLVCALLFTAPILAQTKAPANHSNSSTTKSAPAAGSGPAPKESGDQGVPASTQSGMSHAPTKPAAQSPSPGTQGGAKVAPSQPTLTPILHDFTSLLEPGTKTATAAQLTNIVAFVSSDKNHSYVAIVKTLASDYAIVTNPLPAGETAVSVLFGTKQGGKPSISTDLSFSDVTKNVLIRGDFGAITKVPAVEECGGVNACAVLLASDGATTIGQVKALQVSPSQISLTYTAPATANPVSLRLQNAAAQYPLINLAPTAEGQLVQMRQAITADFCQKNANEDCTTDFFKPAHPYSALGDLHSALDPKPGVKSSYVLDAGNSEFHSVELNALGPDTADVSFTAPSSFKPVYLVIDGVNQSYRFAYTPAPPMNTSDLNYESDDLSTVCDQVQDPSYPADATKTIPDCDHTVPGRLSLKSLSDGSELGYVAMQGNLIIARVTAPIGQEANAITVSNSNTKKSTIARRTVKPGGNSAILNVSMSIMDQVTAQRNYGNRIAKRYIAVTLDVYNPTAKKVQFNKSAMYFDVDYVEAREQGSTWTGFVQGIAEASALGLYQPSVYKPPFVPGSTKEDKTPRIARFGLEQNVRQAPENYLSVLGSFDYTTTKTDDKLKVVELLGSVLTSIATGGLVADASGAFRAGTTVFASTFLPGLRSVVLDTSFINRLRSNLVAQTFQETIQVAAKGSTTTIVLLPRTGILEFTDAQVSVMIKRVIDVHLVPEVISESVETAVKKNECANGNSKDQTRQALGEPSGVTTTPDGGSSFSYSRGAIATVNFNGAGMVSSCSPRTSTEQMDLDKTLLEAKQTLTDLGINATLIPLTDNSTVIADVPGISKTYHFDSKGDVVSAYTFLFKEISAEAKKTDETQAMFESFLEDKASLLSATRSSDIKSQAKAQGVAKAGTSETYKSPDIQNGSITVTFKNSTTSKPDSVVVDRVTFQGDQPKNIN